jgi:hypothetical protein
LFDCDADDEKKKGGLLKTTGALLYTDRDSKELDLLLVKMPNMFKTLPKITSNTSVAQT